MKYRHSPEEEATKSRKQKRKEERLQKKKKKVLHYKRISGSDEMSQPVPQRIPEVEKNHRGKNALARKPKVPAKVSFVEEPQYENEDDRIIKEYQSKMGGDRRVSKDLENDGFDSDLFSFLDDISRKVRRNEPALERTLKKKKKKAKPTEMPKPNDEMEQEQPLEEAQQQQNIINVQDKGEAIAKARKSLNGLLNRISEGNLAKVFREVHDILEGSPKPQVFEELATLFAKFNVLSIRVMINILATQTALICALHHLHGNAMFAIIMRKLVESYLQPGDSLEAQQHLLAQKNAVNIMSYMYLFGSIPVFFIKELIEDLTANVDGNKAQLLFQLIGAVGSRIRSDDPKTLKDIIEVVKSRLEASRNTTLQGNKKAGYIIEDLEQLRFNKKSEVKDERLQFLNTFIRKEVLLRNNLQTQVFVTSFRDVSKGHIHQQQVVEHDQEMEQIDVQLKAKKRYYEQLAKQQKMVTEFRKKVFVTLITAQDYIEGAEKILEFKSKKHNEIASVIVETCTQENTFNPYYPLVASKLVEVIPRFRPALQFMIWDQIKQIQNFSLRKICNLAKFLSRLILQSEVCSLSMLKNFSDLVAVSKHEQIFITAFFEDFFTQCSGDRLNQLIRKVRQGQSNQVFKSVLEEYLQQDYYEYCKNLKKPYLDKIKLARRLLQLKKSER